MIKAISEKAWLRYKALLPKTRDICAPVLPVTLPYRGRVTQGAIDYVPSGPLLNRLREWLNERGEESVFCFLTEVVSGQEGTDFEVGISQLTEHALSDFVHLENVIVAKNFSWALFIDHEGNLHVAGPEDLFARLRQ